MRPTILLPLVLLLAPATALYAQNGDASVDAQIRSALSAGPASVTDSAKVVSGDSVLREGTNDWVCIPDDPGVANNSPVCADQQWMEMFDALENGRTPVITQVGVSYMLQGGQPVSNTDPFASGPTEDNEWMPEGMPHIMLLIPGQPGFDGMSTDPDNGGPWVLWRNTPYAVLIVPTVARPE